MLELKLGGINVELVVSPSNQGLRRDAVYTDINETESIVKGVFFVREKTVSSWIPVMIISNPTSDDGIQYFQLSLCCDRTMSGKAEMWVESPKRWARNRVLSFGLTPQRSLYRFSKWNGYRFRIGSRPKNSKYFKCTNISLLHLTSLPDKSIGSIIIKVLEDGSDDPLQFIFELMHINPVKNPYDGGDDDDNNATYRPGRNSRRSTQVSSIEAPRCRFPRPQRHINLGIQNVIKRPLHMTSVTLSNLFLLWAAAW